MFNRVCLYCFYDKEGIVDSYVVDTLQKLAKVSAKVYVIVNGVVTDAGYSKLANNSTRVICRDNNGYDGGAYAFFFKNYWENEISDEIEELVLCNNSFFGPFGSFEEIFENMESDSDFWGMRLIDRKAFSFIESYFLVFRKKVIEDEVLNYYFTENYKYLSCANYFETCFWLERGLFSFLRSRGYTFDTYVKDSPCYDIFMSPDSCMIKSGLPILKRKCFSEEYYSQIKIKRCIEYIKNETDYPVEILLDYCKKADCNGKNVTDDSEKLVPIFPIEREELMAFIREYHDIYIYGAGITGGNIWSTYKYYIYNMKGFIDENGCGSFLGERVISIGEVPKRSNIIVALNRRNTSEVLSIIKGKHNIITLWMD